MDGGALWLEKLFVIKLSSQERMLCEVIPSSISELSADFNDLG